jgi:hypothetical protein
VTSVGTRCKAGIGESPEQVDTEARRQSANYLAARPARLFTTMFAMTGAFWAGVTPNAYDVPRRLWPNRHAGAKGFSRGVVYDYLVRTVRIVGNILFRQQRKARNLTVHGPNEINVGCTLWCLPTS